MSESPWPVGGRRVNSIDAVCGRGDRHPLANKHAKVRRSAPSILRLERRLGIKLRILVAIFSF
jgi:hypothetical protein